MTNPNNRNDGTPGNQHAGPAKKKNNWLTWLLLALGLIALLFGLRRCSEKNETNQVSSTTTTTTTTPATAGTAVTPSEPAKTAVLVDETSPVLIGTSGVGSFLAGTDAVPRTFVFEKLNFDTAKSDIRAADRNELTDLAAAMKQHPNARIRIVGYADARGAAAANATLGKERAESVKAALVADGIAATRLETASGGENDPVETNATAGGQAENRRTELIVLQR